MISRVGTDYNMPTQKAMDMGLFRIKETTINHSDGHTSISKTPKVTGKGQIYFVNKLLEGRKGPLEITEASEQTMYLRERIQAERYKTVMGIIQCIAITIIGTLFIGMGW